MGGFKFCDEGTVEVLRLSPVSPESTHRTLSDSLRMTKLPGGWVECVKAKALLSQSRVGGDFLAGRSWFRMRTSVLAAAGFFDGGEFHEFDAGLVGVVKI